MTVAEPGQEVRMCQQGKMTQRDIDGGVEVETIGEIDAIVLLR